MAGLTSPSRGAPDAKEIALFIDSVRRRALEHLTYPTPFVRWPNGDLQQEWNSERERVRTALEASRGRSSTSFRYIPFSNIEAAGIAVIKRWATEAKLVGDDEAPLEWLVQLINREFQGFPPTQPRAFTRLGGHRVNIVGLRVKMSRGWRKALSAAAPNTPKRRSGSYSVAGHDGLVLALSRGDWSGGSRVAAGRAARRLGIRWPLDMRKPGPGRGHRKTTNE